VCLGNKESCEADVPVTLEEEAYPVKLDEAEYPVKLDEADVPVKLDEADLPVTLEEEAYTVKQSEVQPLVGRGLLKCDPWLLKDHVGVTNVSA